MILLSLEYLRIHFGLISPTFYEQLLYEQIPKAQTETDDLTGFYALLVSVHVKALVKHVGEINTFSPKKDNSFHGDQKLLYS